MNRKQQAYRNAGIYMGAFFLLLLLLRLDVRAIGADGTNVGLSHLNGAVHFITRSHPWIYAFTQLLGWVALVVAASFVLLAVGVLIKKRTLRSLRGIACLFPVYALMIPFAFFFNVFTVNCGPAFFRGETHPSNSFPSMTTVFCLVVFGTAMMEWHRLFREYKELLAKLLKTSPENIKKLHNGDKKVYRELVLKVHPDRNPDDKLANFRFVVVDKLYKMNKS